MTALEVPRPTEANPTPAWLLDPDWLAYIKKWRQRCDTSKWPCCGHTTERRVVKVGKDFISYLDHEPDCRVGNDYDLSTAMFWFVMAGVIVGPPDPE
jgi:hypothetical protein